MDNKNLLAAVNSISGASFAGLDTLTNVVLTGGKSNPMQGRVQKRMLGATVMAFTNERTNAYDAMIKRRLEQEGKDPGSFQIQPRAWGVRVPNLPIVEHNGKYYLEVIFLHTGHTHEYLLDGQPINKDDIVGLKESAAGEQGGLENKVIIRTFAADSITCLRIDGKVFV